MPSRETADRDPIESAWDSGMQLAFARPDAGAPSVFMQSLQLRAGKSLKVTLRDLTGEGRPLPVSPRAVDWAAGGTGRYRVRGELARGGVGVVLLAHDADLGRDLAVKVLHAQHATDITMLQRFVEEAQIGGQLQHPGIVPVYELGIDLRDQPYFTMKLVQGQTLAALLRERASPSAEQARWLATFARVCETMAYAHARGVVHRDLKPGNVMVGEFGEVLVMDWGFAKVLGKSDAGASAAPALTPVATQRSEPLSVAGSVLGTPAYMPPEQAAGDLERLDARADVFALGAILCEILTGQPPYTGTDVLRRAKAGELDGAYAALARCDADAQLVALCRACLAPNPAARPATAAVVSAAVAEHFATSEQRAEHARVEMAAARARAEEERKRRRLAWALAAVVTVLLAVGGWFYYVHRERVASTAREAHGALNEAWQAVAANDLRGASEAVDRARTVVRAGTPDGATTDAVEKASQRVAKLRRNEDVQRRILEARLRFPPEAGPDPAALLELLRDLQLDPAAPTSAGLTALDEDLACTLAAALGDVGLHVGSVRGGTRVEVDPLLAVADALDGDDLRTAIRAAVRAKDKAALRDLATRSERESAPATTSELLAEAMLALGATDDALAALEAGHARHPDDFWLNHELAQLYRVVDPPQPEASRRHRWLADATNPMRRYRPDPPPGARGPGGPGGGPGGPPGPGRRRGR